MGRVASVIVRTVSSNAGIWWLISLGLTLFYYVFLMLGLLVRFGNLPNYVNFYNWIDNVRMIIASTPSLRDTIYIIQEEWLVEIGYMNYDFGLGLSEWSLVLAPAKMLAVFVLSGLVATYVLLMRGRKKTCSAPLARASGATAGLGASCVAVASISLYWVVCCSTPTWVVGLAMLGLGVSTSLWIEPAGPWLSSVGFTLLIFSIYIAASQNISKDISVDSTAIGSTK